MTSPIFTKIPQKRQLGFSLKPRPALAGLDGKSQGWQAAPRSKLWKDVSDTSCVAYGTVLHLSLLHFTCQLKRASSLYLRCLVSHFSILMNTLFILKQAWMINKWYSHRESSFLPLRAQGTASSPSFCFTPLQIHQPWTALKVTTQRVCGLSPEGSSLGFRSTCSKHLSSSEKK